jgi:flagellar biosynthesis protein FlhF
MEWWYSTMNLRTFEADSMAEALALVKRELGADAVIVNTRTLREGGVLGIRARTRVEITAQVDERPPAPRAQAGTSAQAGARTPAPRPAARDSAVARLYGAVGSSTGAARAAGRDERDAQDAQNAGHDRDDAIRDEMLAGGESPRDAQSSRQSTPGTARRAVSRRAQSWRPAIRADGSSQARLPFQPGRRPPASSRPGPAAAAEAGPVRLVPPPVRRMQNHADAEPSARQHDDDIGTPVAFGAQMDTLRRMVEDVLTETRRGRMPDLPESLFDMYSRLIGQQVADEIARRMIEDVRASLLEDHPDGRFGVEDVKHRVLQRISGMLPDGAPLTIDTVDRPKVVALIGPTGVGKTTTIAKLAAHFKLREKRRVGMITIDTYRIAAVEQLKVYANILDLPLRVVASPAEVTAAIEQMHDCDLILIDTAGRAPRDAARIAELNAFLAAAQPDETHLVLSGAAGEKMVLDAIERFSAAKPDRLIFTKLDEMVGAGLILNVLANVGMSLSYITTGQAVPNDIEVAQGTRLARLLIGEDMQSGGPSSGAVKGGEAAHSDKRAGHRAVAS